MTLMGRHVNKMGNEVQKGFICKPVNPDPNKPIMHYKSHIFICNGGRCSESFGADKISHLRELVNECELGDGPNRIKITKTGCFGACRHKTAATIYENAQRNGDHANNGIWLRQVENLSDKQWKELFYALSKGQPVAEMLDKESILEMKPLPEE